MEGVAKEIRESAKKTAIRVGAYQRVSLRRWLRQNVTEESYPDHLWLDYDLPALRESAEKCGADVDAILSEAESEIIDRIDRGA